MLKNLLWASVLLSLAGCQKSDPALAEKLDRVDSKLDTLARKVEGMARGGGAAAQRPAPPPGPDPRTVYAVAVGDSPVKGPPTAKVTIVEAAEFA
jgi:protein-disulfide isomerase